MTAPSPPRLARRRRRWPGSLMALLALVAVAAPPTSASARAERKAPASTPAPTPAPRDPNDAPMMRAPNGQPDPTPVLATPALVPTYRDRRRFALTLSPAYGSFRLPLLGRSNKRRPGAGGLLEADLKLLPFIWLRAQVGYTAHPLDEAKLKDDESGEVTVVANAGTLHAANAGVGLAVGVDLGPVLPMIDAGVGAFRLGTPSGALAGQRDQPCLDGGGCDNGLTCSPIGVCVVDLIPEVHAGASVDILLGQRWSVGATLRYFALLRDPASIPTYVIGALRAGIRF
ncbi:MAG: hypothetical protein H6710_23630 [Myxococcales bacterium]|nr:hypothetical protein [Myxococcales bacterium]